MEQNTDEWAKRSESDQSWKASAGIISNWSGNLCLEAASPAGLREWLKLPALSVKPIYKNNILVLTDFLKEYKMGTCPMKFSQRRG